MSEDLLRKEIAAMGHALTGPTIRTTELFDAQTRLVAWQAVLKHVQDQVFNAQLAIIRIEDRLNKEAQK